MYTDPGHVSAEAQRAEVRFRCTSSRTVLATGASAPIHGREVLRGQDRRPPGIQHRDGSLWPFAGDLRLVAGRGRASRDSPIAEAPEGILLVGGQGPSYS